MTNKRKSDTQLSLELPIPERQQVLQSQSGSVVTFVNAATLAVRRAAIKRVNESGVFSTIVDRATPTLK